ncbi:dynein heavy chain [Aureobasidium pullulans]|uniref:Dynein heavy chain, cytoplasmic n=1 Tax=Aureobasidium pullulans TaxID=5580 RepID=A0A4V4KS69_AURPU|nr:dynein heavy chain [Aureobasidium pullulans]THZ47931.1 dynein heavy chain [Aureobasidium pullulans]THZ59868.1 dynein heavy chain [Aureobasidium pullulans]
MEDPLVPATNGTAIGRPVSPAPPATSTIDPQLILSYLESVLHVTLGASRKELEANNSFLSPANLPETLIRCQRFASEAQVAIYVQQEALDAIDDIQGDGDALVSTQSTYLLDSKLTYTPSTASCVAILKRPVPILPTVPISSQLSVINLPGAGASLSTNPNAGSSASPFEALHSLVHFALAPYFDACTKSQESNHAYTKHTDAESRTGIPGAKRRIAELELSLRNLQQNIDVPDLHLPIHPVIQAAVEEAAARSEKPTSAHLPQSLLNDAHFLNNLQAAVNGWIKAIQESTQRSRDPSTGTAMQEKNFWLSMESALDSIERQQNSDPVRLSLDVLSQAKRHATAVSFHADTGFKEAADKVQKYNQLMRELPLEELLAAATLIKIQEALDQVFQHINKKLRVCAYPIRRALPLVEAISGDLDTRLHELLHGRSLMHLDFPEFQNLMAATDKIWDIWEDNFKEFANAAREVIRRRGEKFIPIKIDSRHKQTKDRLRYINTFRVNHEQLRDTIANVLGEDQDNIHNDGVSGPVIIEEMGDVDAIDEISQAYSVLKDVDVLDVSEEGTRIWVRAEAAYNERTSRVENSIIARLRDRLALAKNSNEMFRVFSKFNALFVRPKIRSAISEYQTQLIGNVKNDIAALQERFMHPYGHTETHAMAQLRDLPPVSGAIIRTRQIERQLNAYMSKVEDVLGKDWALHVEGQKLQTESNMFRKKLDVKPVFDEWLRDVNRRQLSVSGRLFAISRNRASGNILELSVSFDAQVITLFKEVRNLQWQKFTIPHAINNTSKEARRVYPYAVSLMESVNTYAQTINVIDSMPEVSMLVNGVRSEVQALIAKGTPLKWDSLSGAYEVNVRQMPTGSSDQTESKHVKFIRDFAKAIRDLQEKTSLLSSINVAVHTALTELETCSYAQEAFRQQIDIIQKSVDQLNLKGFSNLSLWVAETNQKIQLVLLSRLQHALRQWISVFAAQKDDEDDNEDAEQDRDVPHFEPCMHEMAMRNQSIYLDPPLESARATWLQHLHNWLSIVCSLPKIQAERFELALSFNQDPVAVTFSDLPLLCVDPLSNAYNAVEDKISVIGGYVDQWLQFQSLWDLQSEQVYEYLGEDLAMWLQLLLEIRKKRETFDTTETTRSFDHLTIEYEQVQLKVNAKYDQWQHELRTQFAQRLGNRMSEVFAALQKARQELEGQSLEASSTAQAVTFITTVQQCKRKVKSWEPEVNTFRDGQKTLIRQRYQFPTDWLYVEQIDGEWTALNQVLDRKSKVIEDQTDALKAKIVAEDRVVAGRITEMTASWNDSKPVSGTIPPEEAVSTLAEFETGFAQLNEQSEMVAKAKEALNLPPSADYGLASLLEEVQDFKSVWANLKMVWDGLNELREQLWTSIQPRKLRQSLEKLIQMTKEMPSRMRQYAAFEHVLGVLRGLLKVNPILSDLRSDAVKERHWIKIFKALRPSQRYSSISMTLGDIWDLQLGPSEVIIRDVITQAQGEMALEEFLRQVKDTWQNYALELVNYQNRCRLIRGWDDLFAKCSEHLNSLQAMRHSPYYKVFEEDASSWEERLNRVHLLFDVWIDVQRQWVYLEGVFTGNVDIKTLLPMESNRFNNINTEFLAVLKKVYKSPLVLDVLNIPGVQKSLERLADQLNRIQKALGEYLERERVSFPRFYFVGDEDLLEIIGNSNDTLRIAKHLKKMFAGISGVVTDEEANITGITSREGEQVMLKKIVSLAKTPRVNEWLGALETNMRETLAESFTEAFDAFEELAGQEIIDGSALEAFINDYPGQIVVLATQACWTKWVGTALSEGGASLPKLFDRLVEVLRLLAASVLGDLDALYRKKCEHLITEFVHQRDTVEKLVNAGADSPTHHLWLLSMRYEYQLEAELLDRVQIKMANAVLAYGFEYLGVPDRLVRTPLTDRCFLTLTQALCQRLGGSPYGPAGTGKTESVKALGVQLGRFTLVFNCDDTFDYQAMGRIFLGISQVGAWGCFDEFNRLEERILSAVSQQIQNIQLGLRKSTSEQKAQIELIGRQLIVHQNTGLFITMNPGYAGRSNLPDNLKKLFRSVAMSKPDKELIAEVMLYSQGFSQAKPLSRQVVPFFDRCGASLSNQPHYDFGLRALKSVLVSSGGLKRSRLVDHPGETLAEEIVEPQIIVQSLRETIAPKLVRPDVDIMRQVEDEVFPGVQYVPAELADLKKAIRDVAAENKLIATDSWMTKVLQLYQIQNIHHGVMTVGSSGTGKSTAWKTLLAALQRVDGIEGVCHIIDPKVMSKESLYGSLDATTREWTDGLFTSILRKIVDNLRGEDSKRHWIIFDGDVDPEWVENLNSVLDDNKLLTLPNGERLNLPANVRIMFEVETLKYATLATVSRCGMVWFSDDTVTTELMISNHLAELRSASFDDLDEDSILTSQTAAAVEAVQNQVADLLQERLATNNFCTQALSEAKGYNHIMEFTEIRALTTLFSLLRKACRSIIEYNVQHPDFPLELEQIESFMSKKLVLALIWSFVGDCPLTDRKTFGDYVASLASIDLPPLVDQGSMIDYDVVLPESQWTDVVIPTVDTVRHEDVLYSWLAEHKPLLLCGPPGSGKTMTLFSALRKLPTLEVVGLNFSSATSPELLVKTLEQYCEYRKTLNGTTLAPTQIGRWLVLFCDEINLPAPDKYGTQRVISFLRQMVEHGGFWRTATKTWVSLERIQFVGACNPPTDAGRTPLGLRFLRHAPLIMVDYPGELSLTQIYGTFNSAVLKVIPSLRGYSDALTRAMIQLYSESQKRFTADIQPHYVYSPRELTRWVRAVYEAIKPLEALSLEGLVRIWAHEALRLFSDRLIAEDERQWTEEAVDRIALEHFPNVDEVTALQRPILYSTWMSKHYEPVDREQLRDYLRIRLRQFCEEELDVPLILFNDVLDHILRIDRVFRQPQGHLILIGVSGSGKTTLSRFVAWSSGLKVFQIKVHGKYTAEDFDDDLRNVLRRCGVKGEKICFIMDESNVLDSGFLERMNTLLANGEVPGLFEGDEFASLMTACKEAAQSKGQLLDSQEELYKWFTQQIVQNLHVVFTMNPPTEGLSSKAATSPALFNRCVLNWFGDWSDQALFQVGYELTQSVDLDRSSYTSPDSIPVAYRQLQLPASHRDAVVNSMVHVHHSMHKFNGRLLRQQNKTTYLTPRHFLDFLSQFVKLYNEKRDDLEEQQRHLNIGLDKLHETTVQVSTMSKSLTEKNVELQTKDAEANEKLQRMIADQREAETRRAASLEVQNALVEQERIVAERREVVLNDLAQAEPAVIEAQKSVSNIKKQHLTEVRSMQNPPSGVKLALESVCTLLGHKAPDWKTIVSIVRRDDFIASIVNYDNERQMTSSHRIKMQREFLSKDDFSFERVNRASKACGPLVQWVEAQVTYSAILDRVGPLREEVTQLEEEALQTKANAQAIFSEIKKLDNNIATYKTEYASLVSQVEAIKSEMARVQSKVDRSMRLIKNLSSERERWEETSKSFDAQMDTIVGDVFLAAAFLAYGGLYDQQYRKAMLEDWAFQLAASSIHHKPHNPMAEYLSTADDRLQWQQNSLPVDDLCTENAIMLQRFNRYPLIIDPSGRTVEFLQNECKDRRLTVTSFLDSSFTKQLESSLRFGNPILIQDAEHLDPILNHVLNKEYQKTGGRVLIQLGRQEIDFSPAFRLYLTTRDPSATFAPDICSRTTFVNFTVTQSSLRTQALNDVLKSERPDVDERRTNLVKTQGEFRLRLRHLEKQLLRALNESQGNILDDDKVIQTLETLKKEASEIAVKAAETDGVMTEVERITMSYDVIAQSCSAIFAVLDQLHHINHFYQFSLQYFVDIFHNVLSASKSRPAGSHENRVDAIIKEIFISTYRSTALTLLQKDRITFAMLLAQASPLKMDKSLIDKVLDEDVTGVDLSTSPELKDEAMARVSSIKQFRDGLSQVSEDEWNAFLSAEFPEKNVPTLGETDNELDRRLLNLLLIKMLRVDRLVPAAEVFITALFGTAMLDISDDLSRIVKEVTAHTPIALSSSPGFDASYKVDQLVERTASRCANVAMGSNESLANADAALANAAATGSWVMVKNVHLAAHWLQNLEKRIDSLKPHPDFRLFLSMESSPKIPVNLLRASRVLSYEQPAGIRANMRDSMASLKESGSQQPVEKARVYFLLAFLHAVVQERLRYAPRLGWSGFWEFNDSDFECSVFIIDTWMTTVAGNRSNIAPNSIPWSLLRILVTETYGGKIDSATDFSVLSQLVSSVLTPAAFEENYALQQGLTVPTGTMKRDFEAWIKGLPEREPPTYLGLEANAEKLLLVAHADEMCEGLRRVMEVLDEGEAVMAEAVEVAQEE